MSDEPFRDFNRLGIGQYMRTIRRANIPSLSEQLRATKASMPAASLGSQLRSIGASNPFPPNLLRDMEAAQSSLAQLPELSEPPPRHEWLTTKTEELQAELETEQEELAKELAEIDEQRAAREHAAFERDNRICAAVEANLRSTVQLVELKTEASDRERRRFWLVVSPAWIAAIILLAEKL